MMLREHLKEVAELQSVFSASNTPQMKLRGEIIRHEIPNDLKEFDVALAASINIELDDLLIEGRDGTGQKTEIPWVRVASKDRSPSATTDWYVVYLFDTTGKNIYLTVGHGSTEWDGIDFRPRPPEQLQLSCAWARECLSDLISQDSSLIDEIYLESRRSYLGPAYEAGTAIARRYEVANLPSDDDLKRDFLFFCRMLEVVYRDSAQTAVPGETDPVVAEIIEESDSAAGKRTRGGGQGFRLSGPQRKAIELHAMDLARKEMERLGWTDIRDTSAKKPYDFTCKEDGQPLTVEVKGTTSSGETIILTRGEVEHHIAAVPNNALILVTGILLTGENATNGEVRVVKPWSIDENSLKVISYMFAVDNN